MAARSKDEEVLHAKYFIRTRTEEFVIEIPRDWKLTFASVNPASAHGASQGYCIRVYEMPNEKLRAVFDSAISFRDVTIPLARKIKSEIGNSKWETDSMGNFQETREVQVDHQLVPETL